MSCPSIPWEQLCRYYVLSVVVSLKCSRLSNFWLSAVIQSVMCFFSARNLSADIHWQICEVYRVTAMFEGKVHKRVRDFKAGCNNIHDECHSSHSSVITEDMVASVEEKSLEYRRFNISTLSNNFPKL